MSLNDKEKAKIVKELGPIGALQKQFKEEIEGLKAHWEYLAGKEAKIECIQKEAVDLVKSLLDIYMDQFTDEFKKQNLRLEILERKMNH